MANLFEGLDRGTLTQVRETLEQLQVGLDSLQGAHPDRRPLRTELDRIECRQVRPLVQKGQESVQLKVGPHQKPLWLSLDWLERWGGTFGSRSSAEANGKRGRDSVDRLMEDLSDAEQAERSSDRGQVPAWLLYLKCPACARRCRVLYSRRLEHVYRCRTCTNPAHVCGSHSAVSGKDKGTRAKQDRLAEKHRAAANRIRRDYLQHTGPLKGGMLAPARASISKPRGMTWVRFEALCRLLEAHETVAMMASLAAWQTSVSKLPGLDLAPTLNQREQERDVYRWANTVLRVDAWALRQRSWHRRGLPRDTPGEGTRRAIARLGTSEDGSGHAPQDCSAS